MALCPADGDHNPSLSIKDSDRVGVLLHCFAGCSLERVRASLGIAPQELRSDGARPKCPSRQSNGYKPIRQAASEFRRIVATYDYTDEQRQLLFPVVRYEPKKFRQRQPDGNGSWLWNLDGVRRALYRLPELLAAKFFRLIT